MAKNAPGQHYRKGITLVELSEMGYCHLPDDHWNQRGFVNETAP